MRCTETTAIHFHITKILGGANTKRVPPLPSHTHTPLSLTLTQLSLTRTQFFPCLAYRLVRCNITFAEDVDNQQGQQLLCYPTTIITMNSNPVPHIDRGANVHHVSYATISQSGSFSMGRLVDLRLHSLDLLRAPEN